ncbi:MAG TPA: 50S ribosomal protein L34e [Candidatus Nanoarchaeia archaeon]|nr:50S ribosomal protein L34e [Candidatus Nanoarchaeia archaeon]
MTIPRLRSRSLRKIYTKVPGNRTAIHYKRKKPKTQKCGGCGAVLAGIPREFPFKMKTMAKTQKRPQRPYGGVLCTKCLRNKIVMAARA